MSIAYEILQASWVAHMTAWHELTKIYPATHPKCKCLLDEVNKINKQKTELIDNEKINSNTDVPLNTDECSA